jgi:FMN phosphatase YigB (HAD superfamily)
VRRYDCVLFDFHGVLCHDYFYTAAQARFPEAREFIETRVFGRGSGIPGRWMRGELSSHDVNRLISETTGIDVDELTALFHEDVAAMRLDARLLDLAASLSASGVAVGIVTDNMDVFSQVTVPRHRLLERFSAIVNSCDYGCLKHEDGGRLFEVALALLGRPGAFDRALLVDDSPTPRAVFTSRGGDAYPYAGYEAFRLWLGANLGLS